MHINFNRGTQPKGLLARVLTTILGAVFLVAALMFSAVFVAVAAVAGLILGLYFWWKTRALRQQIHAQRADQGFAKPPPEASQEGEVIEGEAVRVTEDRSHLANDRHAE